MGTLHRELVRSSNERQAGEFGEFGDFGSGCLPAKTAQQLCYKLGPKGRLRKGNFKLSRYEGPA